MCHTGALSMGSVKGVSGRGRSREGGPALSSGRAAAQFQRNYLPRGATGLKGQHPEPAASSSH